MFSSSGRNLSWHIELHNAAEFSASGELGLHKVVEFSASRQLKSTSGQLRWTNVSEFFDAGDSKTRELEAGNSKH